MNTRSSPSRSAAPRTACDPGTTSALTCGATCCPRTMRAASRRSESRALVHEPTNATSILVPFNRLPGRKPMKSSASSTPARSPAIVGRLRQPLVDVHRLPGLMPHVTVGRIAVRVESPPRRRMTRPGQRRRPRHHAAALVERVALRRESASAQVVERRSIGVARSRRARRLRSTCCRSSSARPSTSRSIVRRAYS